MRVKIPRLLEVLYILGTIICITVISVFIGTKKYTKNINCGYVYNDLGDIATKMLAITPANNVYIYRTSDSKVISKGTEMTAFIIKEITPLSIPNSVYMVNMPKQPLNTISKFTVNEKNIMRYNDLSYPVPSKSSPISYFFGGQVGPTGPVGQIGSFGHTGPVGQIGPVGHTGPAGPTGPPAIPRGSIISGFETNRPALNKPMYSQEFYGNLGLGKWSGTSFFYTGSTGPTGPVDPAGPTGPEGPVGPTGPDGPTGPVGQGGPAGSTGPVGPAGQACEPCSTGNTGQDIIPNNPFKILDNTVYGITIIAYIKNTFTGVDTYSNIIVYSGSNYAVDKVTGIITFSNQIQKNISDILSSYSPDFDYTVSFIVEVYMIDAPLISQALAVSINSYYFTA